MPYCQRCGKEYEEGASFCTSCGTDLQGPLEPRYRRRDTGSSAAMGLGRGVVAIVALIILMVGAGLAIGGFTVLSVHSSFSDTEGYIMSHPTRLSVDSHAIVQKAIDIHIDTDFPVWIPPLGELVRLKVVATSTDPSKEVFIGIAGISDASSYLTGTNYHEIDNFSWEFNPWDETSPNIRYLERPGGAPSAPVVQSFWSTHVYGSGTQTLIWEPVIGNFWVVGMNADGSAGVDMEVQLGARLPILRTIGGILLAIGLIILLIALSLFRGVL